MMEILSTENIAAVKLAIILCNDRELKREILCTVGSEYYTKTEKSQYCDIEMWNRIIQRKSETILKSLELSKFLQDKVMGAILTIGRKMLCWAKYHQQIVGLSCEYAAEFLNINFFTQQGTVNTTKVSEELMDRNLSVKQKYVLACLHYRTELITSLFSEMNHGDKKELVNSVRYPVFVKYLTSCLMRSEVTLHVEDQVEYALEMAVKSGSIEAVQGVIQFADSQRDIVLSIAKKALRCAIESEKIFAERIPMTFISSATFWIPIDNYIDIILFLLPKMCVDQIAELLSGVGENNIDEIPGRNCSLLKYFLNWPYQDYFMKTVSLLWKSLPKNTYCNLLRIVCEKIEEEVRDPTYGEEKIYDYRQLLKEFWCFSPDDFKRYAFGFDCDNERDFDLGKMFSVNYSLFYLLDLKHFTYEDGKLIRLIMESATHEEKEIFFFRWGNEKLWVIFMHNLEALHRLVQFCFSNKEEADTFKRKFICTSAVFSTCVKFIEGKNDSALHSFIEWISLSEEEIKEMKKALAFSDAAKDAYIRLAEDGKWNEIEAIFNWCCLSEEEVNEVKLETIREDRGLTCMVICFRDGREMAERFCKPFLLSEEEMLSLRQDLISTQDHETNFEYCLCTFGSKFFRDFMNFCILSENDLIILKSVIIYSRPIKWKCISLCLEEGVEKAKKFCEVFFTTEDEMRDFCKKLLFPENFRDEVCARLLVKYSIEAVSNFLNFCLISEEELKKLKKNIASRDGVAVCERLFTHTRTSSSNDSSCDTFSRIDWGDVEQFLTWCFPSEEEIRNFKKNVLLPELGPFIHFDLIKSNAWTEAKTFLGWLELSHEEIKELKKYTLEEYKFQLCDHVHGTEYAASVFGGKEGIMKLFLMWFVSDKKEVDPKLIEILKWLFQPEDERDVFIKFEMMLEQHLSCL